MIPVVLVASGRRTVEKFLSSYLQDQGIEAQFVERLEPAGKEFAIAQIKDLIKNTSFSAPQRRLYVLYEFGTASLEAQNAFLKTLEEHQENVGFVMVVAAKYALLPTILSRSRVVHLAGAAQAPDRPLEAVLSGFVERPTVATLGSELLEVTTDASQKRVFTAFIMFFRERLSHDPKAPAVLTEALQTFATVAHNNVNPQHALDHLMLFVKKMYTGGAGLDKTKARSVS